jgi:SAM-dependent methyltransferase
MGERDVPASAFSAERLQRVAEMEAGHFWFLARRLLLDRLLDRYGPPSPWLGLDLGCGGGGTLASLAGRCRRAVGLDLRPEQLAGLRQRLPQAWLARADAATLPFADASMDLVTAFDLLEHVDDGAALEEIRRVLCPGGVALISVPAGPWLWSHRDEAAGHRRRYDRPGLAARLRAAGLAPLRIAYYQCLLFPLVVASRVLGRRGPRLRDFEDRPPGWLNEVLAAVNRLEVRLSGILSWPFGSSLVAVCCRA